jgi:ribonuclease P protein component
MAIKITRLPADEFRAKGYKTIPTPFFLLKIKKNQKGATRVGVVVGKSVHKTAVKRNFWKRQAREALSPHALAGNDILVIASASIDHLTKKQFKEELARAIKKI